MADLTATACNHLRNHHDSLVRDMWEKAENTGNEQGAVIWQDQEGLKEGEIISGDDGSVATYIDMDRVEEEGSPRLIMMLHTHPYYEDGLGTFTFSHADLQRLLELIDVNEDRIGISPGEPIIHGSAIISQRPNDRGMGRIGIKSLYTSDNITYLSEEDWGNLHGDYNADVILEAGMDGEFDDIQTPERIFMEYYGDYIESCWGAIPRH